MMIRAYVFALASLLAAGPALAQADEAASQDEAAKVRETLQKVSCTAEEIEKETSGLFEIDDAQCSIGQYDIKLDGSYNIISMTRD